MRTLKIQARDTEGLFNLWDIRFEDFIDFHPTSKINRKLPLSQCVLLAIVFILKKIFQKVFVNWRFLIFFKVFNLNENKLPYCNK